MHAQLASLVMEDARVLAFQHPLVAPPPAGFRGGPVIEDQAHAACRHTRYWRPVDTFLEHPVYTTTILDEHHHAGPIYHHFGHFLSEMVHRLLPSAVTFDYKRWLFVGPEQVSAPQSYNDLPRFLKEVLEFFRIDFEDVTLVNQNSIVRTLGVVEQGSDFGGGPKAGYLRDLGNFSEARLKEYRSPDLMPEKIYVSRRYMPVGGSLLGERYIEDLLESEGFAIYFPERHSLIHQMRTYCAAKIVVFSEGSACHGTELLGEQALERCYLIVRRADHKDIFSRVLSPRSRCFKALESAIYLGSIVGGNSGAPSAHHGVSISNPEVLIASFQANNIAKLKGFSLSRFYEAAENDMGRYILENVKAGTISGLEDISATVSRLAKFAPR